VKRRLIPYNRAVHVELAPETPTRPQAWTPEQCQTFLTGIARDRCATVYHLLLVTGLRRGEVVGLRWMDVDFDEKCLWVRQQITDVRGQLIVGTPKTKRGARAVPLDAGTVQLLRDHQEAQSRERALLGDAWQHSGLVFVREDGSALRPDYVSKHFLRLCADVGSPVIRLHDLRHTSASLALVAGVNIKVVSERLGHSTTATTADLYTHVIPTVARSAADQLAAVLAVPVRVPSADVSAVLAHPAQEAPIAEPEARAPPADYPPDTHISAGQGRAPS
jgi:integrase